MAAKEITGAEFKTIGALINNTFKSYIADGPQEDGVKEEVEKKANNFFVEGVLDPYMLPGEKLIAKADGILKFVPFSDRKQGVSGHLFVTNFKITFVTADRSSYGQNEGSKRQRNKVLGDHDIPLTKVDSIYQIVSGGKKRKLQAGASVSNSTKYLELHCKDFQIHTFGFKFCPKDQNKLAINAIVHHSYPTRSDLLFAYDYGHSGKFAEQKLETRLFYNKQDWELEIKRLNAVARWRVADMNTEYCNAPSMPEYFVVPVYLLNTDLVKSAVIYNDYRLPTWCYTHKNSSCLVRMSHVAPESISKEGHEKIISAIKQACDLTDEPKRVDLSRLCPSLRDLQLSYEKLKECCMTDSVKEFLSTDLAWYSNLDNTQWLQAVCKCLQITFSIVVSIHKDQQTIIIAEETGCDFSCIVASLVQMCLDPHCRTQVGFQSLIQKEWVAMGHPFQKRHGLTQENETERAPIFLLFLDCCWQLLQQYPSSFAFTETYLTTIWDCVHLGLCDTFLFNNCHQRRKFMMEGRRMAHIHLPSVWDWQFQLGEIDLTLFNNPLYVMRTKLDLNEIVSSAKKTLTETGATLRDEMYKMKLTDLYLEEERFFPDVSGVLYPQFTPLVVKLWKQCFIRWNIPAQIIGGGNPSRYLQQCVLVEEVISLHHRLKFLQQDSQRSQRPKSELIFGVEEKQKTPALLKSCVLTSSFPFSHGPPNKAYNTLLWNPIADYVQNSTIDYDYTNADD
ncbi:myotubularin-related protein 10-B-like isoform X2 [Haliotis rufescens]|uniref:myotubularin-related protein 10-B-like isoform X2 n=1 Tax=Haliotis rufescens TaxID=6454 RepID=UPI00201EFF14|nr:myotubularin-related protein 10-B-like isoform X2 [Haliotis rufescens]